MREAAADRSALANRVMADRACGMRNHRDMLAHERIAREVSMADEGADDEPIVLQSDLLQFGEAVDVDEMRRLRKTHVHHRRQALSAGDDLGCLPPRCQRG